MNSRVNENTRQGPSFSLRNRLARLLWGFCWLALGRFSPRPMHGLRAALLRLFGAKIGRGVHVYPGVRIWAPWNLEIGDETGVADGVELYCQGPMRLGNRVVISQGSYLCGGTHDYTKPGFPLVVGSIQIENEVWVAAQVFIHPDVTIAEGAVIGARAVVTEDMPAWTICAGHPCRPLKPRPRHAVS